GGGVARRGRGEAPSGRVPRDLRDVGHRLLRGPAGARPLANQPRRSRSALPAALACVVVPTGVAADLDRFAHDRDRDRVRSRTVALLTDVSWVASPNGPGGSCTMHGFGTRAGPRKRAFLLRLRRLC